MDLTDHRDAEPHSMNFKSFFFYLSGILVFKKREKQQTELVI